MATVSRCKISRKEGKIKTKKKKQKNPIHQNQGVQYNRSSRSKTPSSSQTTKQRYNSELTMIITN